MDRHIERILLPYTPASIKEKPAKYILAYELAQKTKDRVDIRNQLLNIFMPAHDATAVALTNVFFNLARHPAVWAKLGKDVLGLGSSELTVETLKSIQHLQNIINETFRLNPAIGITSRTALKDIILPIGGGPNGISPRICKKG